MSKYTELENLLLDIQSKVDTLLRDLRVKANQVVVTEGLSEITEKLGLIQAGELRVGNGVDPGSGFSGTRLGYPPMTYDSELYNLVGVDNDTMQFGVRSSDGVLVAGGGSVILGLVSKIAGWDITADEIKKNGIILNSTNDVIYVGSGTPRMIIDGTSKLFYSSNFVTGEAGFQIEGASGNAEFNNVKVRGELRDTVLSVGTTQGTSGTLGVFKSVGLLKTEVTTTNAGNFDIDIQDPATGHIQQYFAGDIIRLQNVLTANWLTVVSVSDQVDFYQYTCTLSNGTPGTFPTGALCANYGHSGDGYLILTADDTNAPYYSVRTHAGSPWTTTTEIIRIGNMNGFMGNTTDTFGFGMTRGEMRLGTGVVGTDFTGLRIAQPAFSTPFGVFNMAGFNTNTLQFGIRASDGVAIFFGGKGRITENGIELFGANYGIVQVANQGLPSERTGKMGMFYPGADSDPAAYGWDYSEPAPDPSTTELVTNGGFETDTTGFATPTGWTLTADTGVWSS